MKAIQKKQYQHSLRKGRVRAKVSGTSQRPRLAVFRSLQHIYAQLIDDVAGKTLAYASSKDTADKQKKTEAAASVGRKIAEQAKEKNITTVVFDRGGNRYHGRVKALAEGAREGGLEF